MTRPVLLHLPIPAVGLHPTSRRSYRSLGPERRGRMRSDRAKGTGSRHGQGGGQRPVAATRKSRGILKSYPLVDGKRPVLLPWHTPISLAGAPLLLAVAVRHVRCGAGGWMVSRNVSRILLQCAPTSNQGYLHRTRARTPHRPARKCCSCVAQLTVLIVLACMRLHHR